MDRQAVLEKLSEGAREQGGYVSAAQAKRLAIDGNDLARLATSGDLRRVRRGVYALHGAFTGPREDLMATWLRLIGGRLPWDRTEPPAVASHRTAAQVHGFGAFPPDAPTFTVFRRRFDPADGSMNLYTAALEPADWEWTLLPEGMRLPVTSAARTIVDLAFAGEDRSHVVDALDDARDAGLVDDTRVKQALARRTRRGGRGSAAWLAKQLHA